MRVLLLVPEFPPDAIGGGGVVFEALRREYSSRHDVRVVSGWTGRRVDAHADAAAGVHRIREVPLPHRLWFLATTMPPTPSGLARLSGAIRDADVVHAHGFGFPVVDTGIRLAARRGIPVLHTLHGFPVSQTKRGPMVKAAFRAYHATSGRPALRRGAAYTAVSDEVAELYRLRYGLSVRTIPNGVDLPDPEPWPELDRFADGRPLVVNVGRLEWIKGLDTVIRALARIEPDARPVAAFIGGDHGDGPALRALAGRCGVERWCWFAGSQPRARVAYAYRIADACVVASHTEAFPAVPLEAMLAGTALITTRLPGIASYAVPSANCEMFDAGDDEELSVTMTTVLRNASLRSALAERGRETAARFRWPSVAQRYEALLRDLTGRRVRS